MNRFLPFLNWLPNYNTQNLSGDLFAGLTVGVMLIPQGMAYAMLAGLPPIYGLYASIWPLIVYGLLGTSRQLAVGPVAMVSLLIATGVGKLAETGTETYIELAIILALIAGLLQWLMGVFRLGFLVNFLSHPVISGFTSAAALIIGISQLKHLLGVSIPRSHSIFETIGAAVEAAPNTNMTALAIGIGAIFILLIIKRLKVPIPGPLVVVVLGVTLVWLLRLDNLGVAIVGDVPGGLPSINSPTFDFNTWKELFPIALTISLIGFMESIAVAKAVQAKHRDYKVIPNQELIALGTANIIGSFFQAFPTTGGFSRTAVNDQAGAKTGLASIFSAILISLTLLFLTPLFYYLPNAILASIIMVAVFGLIDWKEVVYLFKTDRSDLFMLLITFVCTLLIGIEQGILIGVALSMGAIVYRTTKPHTAVLGRIPGITFYKNIDRFDHLEQRKDILIFRFDAMLYFANTTYFMDTIESLVEDAGPALKLFILDADSINRVDSSALHTLRHLHEYLRAKNIELYLVGVKGPVRDRLRKDGLINDLGENRFFLLIQHAVDYFDEKPIGDYRSITVQSNPY